MRGRVCGCYAALSDVSRCSFDARYATLHVGQDVSAASEHFVGTNVCYFEIVVQKPLVIGVADKGDVVSPLGLYITRLPRPSDMVHHRLKVVNNRFCGERAVETGRLQRQPLGADHKRKQARACSVRTKNIV